MRPTLTVLEKPLIEQIVDEAFKVLETSGVLIEDPHALEKLKKVGLVADPKNNRVLYPRAIVEKALADAPSSLTLHDRDGNLDRIQPGLDHQSTPSSKQDRIPSS